MNDPAGSGRGKWQPPALELPGSIGWRSRYSEIIFADPPYLVLQATPVFSGGQGRLADRGVVWDPLALWESIVKPGAHYLLTCDCGYAPDTGIEEAVLVSHPDTWTVVWELDIKGLRPALDDSCLPSQGFLRLVFPREDYEGWIGDMLRELRDWATRPNAHSDLSEVYGLEHLRMEFPQLETVRVDEFEPNIDGWALERLLDLDRNAPRRRTPIWPRGTAIDLGFFEVGDGHELMAVDGEPLKATWPGRYFTRWEALTAFRAWLATVQRDFALPAGFVRSTGNGRNRFVLLQASDRSRCHAAGRRLAQVLQECCDEGATAPGVTVRYVDCDLSVATVAAGLEGSADLGGG